MALLVPDVGEVELLSRAVNLTSPDDCVLHLYTNDKTPAEGDTVADYTESTGSGYAAETLTGSSWTVTTTTGTTTGEYPQVTFTYTGAEPNIYGYYVTNNAGTTLLWAERFSDGPYAIPSGGGSVKITPKIELE
jgi:hypothetical protein